eukprot:9931124-Prorocentrum_lima.AAC.1
MHFKASSSFSPLPRRTPRPRLRDKGPKHVPNVSPTPLSPMRVLGCAPNAIATLRISQQPR